MKSDEAYADFNAVMYERLRAELRETIRERDAAVEVARWCHRRLTNETHRIIAANTWPWIKEAEQ